jgi:hypothetical protein
VKVLIACEFSGTIRDAFASRGHEAWSCDLLETSTPPVWTETHRAGHYRGDVREILDLGWDLMVACPPCTDLAVSGARHFAEKRADGRQQRALEFVAELMDAPIDRIAIENPVSVISTYIRKPDQMIQPWQFGDAATKRTCLWLKGLPLLEPTTTVKPARFDNAYEKSMQSNASHSLTRARIRSMFYPGIAAAMAEQWGRLPVRDQCQRPTSCPDCGAPLHHLGSKSGA